VRGRLRIPLRRHAVPAASSPWPPSTSDQVTIASGGSTARCPVTGPPVWYPAGPAAATSRHRPRGCRGSANLPAPHPGQAPVVGTVAHRTAHRGGWGGVAGAGLPFSFERGGQVIILRGSGPLAAFSAGPPTMRSHIPRMNLYRFESPPRWPTLGRSLWRTSRSGAQSGLLGRRIRSGRAARAASPCITVPKPRFDIEVRSRR
jgi:hypothetical protein